MLSETRIRNEMDIGIGLQSTNVVFTLFVKMLKENFFLFPVKDIFELDCWLSTIPAPALDMYGIRAQGTESTLALRKLAIAVGAMNFTFDCIDCSSAKLNEIPDLLASPIGREDATESANNVLDYLLSMTEGDDSFGQTQIDRYLAEAPKRCRHRPEYDANTTESTQYKAFEAEAASEDSITFLVAMIVAAGLVIAGSVVIVVVVRWIVSRRHRKWLVSLPDEQVLVIYKEQQQEDAIEEEKNGLTEAMYKSPELPALVRYLVPVILVANIGLFLSGHFSLGGSVRIYLQFAGDVIVVDDFYSFSIAQSAIELYNAGAKELGVSLL
jgi:hypothetical protein